MPTALSKLPDRDAPLKKLAPTGEWIGREPTEYFVRAGHAEDALTLAAYCHYVLQGQILARYAGRVAHSYAELSEQSDLRAFRVLVGSKPGPTAGQKWMATEVSLTEGDHLK